MNPFWTLLSLGALFGFVLSGLVGGIIYAIVAITRKLRPWAHLPDEEGGMGYLGRAKFKDGHLVVGKGDDEKRYPVNVSSRSVTNMGIIYTLGRQTGANLRVPRKSSIRAALDQDPGAQLIFDVVDPGLLARTWTGRVAQETIDNQTRKDDWKKSAILPLSILFGIFVIGAFITIGVMAGGR